MLLKKKFKNIFIFVFFLFVLSFFKNADAANLNERLNFNVDNNYDASARSQVSAILIKITPNIYFYVEKSWWDLQGRAKQDEILTNIDLLSLEFNNKIYPTLTSVFGSEWKPGVDGDDKITVFFHSMKEGIGGYFRSDDEYIKLQIPDSNEREMLYLPIDKIDNLRLLKIVLAHEFVHLITFNQKDRMKGGQEEIWLNEARADYASTILGYDDFYEGSNLQRKVKDFLQNPSDSLTEWRETKYDYAVVNLFMHYVVDHYGINILTDSLKSKLAGIQSINEILLKNGSKENFSEIFTNWTIAMIINDCLYDLKYCYLNKNLNNLRINPTLNFLPLVGNSSLSVINVIKNWSGNWQKIIGGSGDLKLEFSSSAGLNFQVPYIIYGKDNSYSVNFLKLDKNQKGQINIKNFGDQYNSLIIIPSLQTKSSSFNGFELTYPYTFTVSITGMAPVEDHILIQKLLSQIDYLKRQIAAIQSGNNQSQNSNLCRQINSNLYFGIKNSSEVNCLQQFLKSQGSEIYPEGFVTGNFGNLTKLAVARFQEKYKEEILTPIGFKNGTGFVGSFTRKKINQILVNGK